MILVGGAFNDRSTVVALAAELASGFTALAYDRRGRGDSGDGESPDWLRAGARAVADTVPGARHLTLDGQDHGVLRDPAALRPLLTDFLA